MADKLETDLIVKAISEGFEKVAADMKGLSRVQEETAKTSTEGSKKTHGLGEAFLTMGKNAAMSAAMIAGWVVIAKKAFDLGQASAQVRQMKESFDTLVSSIGASNQLLYELKNASRGTVSEMVLMSGTAALLAGVTDEFGRSLADTAPRILEIAKAANKLNPLLGDTAFLYQSLMIGLKRGSPMIIDNTGLLVRVGEANAKLAEQLGKSVEELTAEEARLALLNATLEAGDRLIQQVGNDVSSQTDAWDVLTVSLNSTWKSIKTGIGSALQPLAEHIAQNERVRTVSNYWAEYAEKVMTAEEQQRYWGETMTTTNAGLNDLELRLSDVDKVYQKFGKSAENNSKFFEVFSVVMYRVSLGILSAADAIEILDSELRKLGNYTGSDYLETQQFFVELAKEQAITAEATAKKLQDLGYKAVFAASTQNKLTDAMRNYNKTVGNLVSEHDDLLAALDSAKKNGYDANREAIDALQKKATEIRGSMQALQSTNKSGTEEYKALVKELKNTNTEMAILRKNPYVPNVEEIGALTTAIRLNEEAQAAAADAMAKATSEMILQQAAAGLDSQSALALAHSMGLVSEADYGLASIIQSLRAEFDENADGMISASEGADEYAAKIADVNRVATDLTRQGIPTTLENMQTAWENLVANIPSVVGTTFEVSITGMTPEEMTGAYTAELESLSQQGVILDFENLVKPPDMTQLEWGTFLGTLQAMNERAGTVQSDADAIAGAMTTITESVSSELLSPAVTATGDLGTNIGTIKTEATNASTPMGTLGTNTSLFYDAGVRALEILPNMATKIATLGLNSSTAAGQVEMLVSAIGRLQNKTITITVNYQFTGFAGGQNGLNMTIPPGFPNDSFVIGATSGEHVSITPNGGRNGWGGGGGGGGDSYYSEQNNYYVASGSAAALVMADARRAARQRLNRAM